MNRKKKVIERDGDDTHDSPLLVDGIHSADERAILFQEQFTNMWTDTVAHIFK
jgi:hypothetical protein